MSRTSLASFLTILPVRSHVRLEFVDVTGHRVRTRIDWVLDTGSHDRSATTSELPAGVYFITMSAGRTSRTQKLVILR